MIQGHKGLWHPIDAISAIARVRRVQVRVSIFGKISTVLVELMNIAVEPEMLTDVSYSSFAMFCMLMLEQTAPPIHGGARPITGRHGRCRATLSLLRRQHG